MTRSLSATGLCSLLLLCPAVVSLQGCTDLGESPSSSITPENFYRTPEEVIGGLAGVYAQLRNTLWAYYNLSEISSDEMIVPTRGQDWFDNGRWLELHRQTWEANSPAGGEDVNAAWADAFTGIARANLLLEALEKVILDSAFEAGVRAELRTLRAFYYYQLMDLFGGVPIVEDTKIEARERATRREVFDHIEAELLTARVHLPDAWAASNNGRMTKGAADAILASMYLNAGVFTKETGIDITGYNSCLNVPVSTGPDACQAAIDAADRILNSPAGYTLETDWRSNFRSDNHTSLENILVVKHLNQDGLGLNFVMRLLHYNQINPTPWNGFATLADAYNAFDPDDQRRAIFLIGQQYNLDSLARGDTVPVNDRAGNPLVFTATIGDATAAGEHEGARILKWPLDPNHVSENNSNDFAYFRLGEIYLIKAEALNEITPGDPNALLLLNQLRERVFDPDEPLLIINRDAILSERLFELTAESKRRQDLIRFGRYDEAWFAKQAWAGQDHRVLMPIPQPQIDANPMLTQNPGYN